MPIEHALVAVNSSDGSSPRNGDEIKEENAVNTEHNTFEYENPEQNL